MLSKLSSIGNRGVRIITIIIAVIFLLAGFFTLWDMYKTEMRAFASYDLLKYRPDIEHNEPPYLDELLDINPDTAAWVTLYGTNIDYPIFQGETDNEYLNKDAYGKYTMTGSIFLSVLNHKDFSDPYNLLYGHHMQNGSMFGDIDKFKKSKKFFFNKNHERFRYEEGVLIRENEVYNLHVFAVVETDAYDNNIYRADKSEGEMEEFLSYARSKAKFYNKKQEGKKILAMSTCDNATTNARTVLLCNMVKRTAPLPTREEEQLTKHVAIGHPMSGAYWALLNLAALLLCLYIIFPVHVMLSKLLAKIKDGKKNRKSEKAANKKKDKKDKKEEKKKRKAQRGKKIYIIALVLTGIASIVLFILCEDMHKPLQMVDIYTPVFIILTIMAWTFRKLKNGENSNGKIDKNERNGNGSRRVPLRTALSAYILRIRQFYFSDNR